MLDTNPKLATPYTLGATTHGWDTVFGIRFADVNSAIVRAGTTPTGFDFVDPGVELINGTYTDWRVTGGTGHILQMTLPVTELTLQFDGEAAIVRRQVEIDIEVELTMLPAAGSAARATHGQMVELRLKAPDANAVVTPLAVRYPALPPVAGFPGQPASQNDGLVPTDIQNVFARAINQSGELTKFNHAFAAVNLNARAAHDAFAWLAPTKVSYGVTSRDGDGVLALLCMTGGRDAPGNQDVSPELIAEGARSGFLISKEMFLRNMLMIGMTVMFDDPKTPGKTWPQDYFEIAGGGTRLTNKYDMAIKNFEINGTNEPARLPARGFEADLSDTWMTLRYTRFQHSYHWGWYDVFHNLAIDTQLQLSKDGKHLELILGNGEGGDKEVKVISHNAVVEKTAAGQAVDWALLVVDILLLAVSVGQAIRAARIATEAGAATDAALQGAASVTIRAADAAAEGGVQLTRGGAVVMHGALAAVTPAESTAMRFLSSAFYGITAAVTAANVLSIIDTIWQAIENGSDRPEKEIPDISIFARMAMEPIRWPDQSGLTLTKVAFNGGVQMSGEPTFA